MNQIELFAPHYYCNLDRVKEIVRLLTELGIPGRKLRVREAVDTSDVWSKLSFRVQLNNQEYTLDLTMMATGFEGEDAELLRTLLRTLLRSAGENIRGLCC